MASRPQRRREAEASGLASGSDSGHQLIPKHQTVERAVQGTASSGLTRRTGWRGAFNLAFSLQSRPRGVKFCNGCRVALGRGNHTHVTLNVHCVKLGVPARLRQSRQHRPSPCEEASMFDVMLIFRLTDGCVMGQW